MCPARASTVSDLVGLWHFDEETGITAEDDSGNNNIGTIHGATYSVPGHKGNGTLEFFGGSPYVEIANEEEFDFDRFDPFTFGAWILTMPAGSPYGVLISKFDFDSDTGILLFKMGTADGIVLGVYLENEASNGTIYVRGTTDIADNQWHYVFLTYDGTSDAAGIHLYIDGSLETLNLEINTLTTGTILNDAPLTISSTDSSSWWGMIDEVHVASSAWFHVENWVITDSLILEEDHFFANYAGIIIDADYITLDLNGYDVTGCGPLTEVPEDWRAFWYIGIHIGQKQLNNLGSSNQAHTGVIIKDTHGGSEISGFNRGIGIFTSDSNEISGLEIHGNKDGIYIWFSSDNTIQNNLISGNSRHGIKLFGVPSISGIVLPTSSNDIINNEIMDNGNGVFLDGGFVKENRIYGNNIHDNQKGIRLWNFAFSSPSQRYEDIGAPRDNSIEHNNIHHNTIGIDVEVSIGIQRRDVRHNTIRNNIISYNVEYGIRTDALVDARDNWWGSPQGPTAETNKEGDGDQVSKYVRFKPWLAQEPSV
jgi:parallel beta-helix repeat protein